MESACGGSGSSSSSSGSSSSQRVMLTEAKRNIHYREFSGKTEMAYAADSIEISSMVFSFFVFVSSFNSYLLCFHSFPLLRTVCATVLLSRHLPAVPCQSYIHNSDCQWLQANQEDKEIIWNIFVLHFDGFNKAEKFPATILCVGRNLSCQKAT